MTSVPRVTRLVRAPIAVNTVKAGAFVPTDHSKAKLAVVGGR